MLVCKHMTVSNWDSAVSNYNTNGLLSIFLSAGCDLTAFLSLSSSVVFLSLMIIQ